MQERQIRQTFAAGLTPRLLGGLHLVPRRWQRLEQIGLRGDDLQRRTGKQGLDFLKEMELLLGGRPARPARIEQEQGDRADVLEGGDGLLLDGVAVLHRPVEQTWSVEHLVRQATVGEVAHVELLGGEGVVVDLHRARREGADQRGLSDVRSATDHDDGLHGVEMRQLLQGLTRLAKPSKARTDATHHRSDAPVGFLSRVVHERDARRAGHFAHVLRRNTTDLPRAPLQHGQVVAVLVGAHTGFDHRHVEGRRLVKGRPETHGLKQGGAQHVGRGLYHPRELFPGAENAVGILDPVRRLLGAPEGLVQHLVLGEDRWKPPPLNAHGQAPTCRPPPPI